MNSRSRFASYRTHVFFAISLSLVLAPGAVSAGRLGNAASYMTSATYAGRVFMGRGMVVPARSLVLAPDAVSAGRFGNAVSSMTSATYTARVFIGRGMVVPASELDFYRVAQDRDGDLLSDNWELQHFGDLAQSSTGDGDGDGLDNVAEFLSGTDPTLADSDGDNIPDGWEVLHGLDPLDQSDGVADADNDGMLNIEEFRSNSDPERYVIHLDAGWNLVSLGTQPQEHSVTGIFGDAHSGAVWTWQDGRFQTTTTMQSQKGYWIYAVEQADIEVQLP